jgi:hypothetical protein
MLILFRSSNIVSHRNTKQQTFLTYETTKFSRLNSVGLLLFNNKEKKEKRKKNITKVGT